MTRPTKVNGLTDEERWRRCTGKGRWPDQVSAMASAIYALERDNTVQRLYTYRCKFCKGWHLTKKRQSGQEPVTLEKYKKGESNEV